VFRSVDFDSRDKALSQLTDYINLDLEYVYEVCEGEDCHYFKITHKGLLLIESNLYSYSEDLKGVIDEIKLDIDDLYNDLFVEKYKLSSKAEGIKKEFESKLKLNGLSKFH